MEARLKVLVPQGLVLETMATPANIDTILYDPGEPWPPGALDATVVVVGYENAAATGSRFVELPDLRLVQTLNAGYEQWLPMLPDGVMLSNGRGAHGGSTAEWVVAVLLTIYRDLRLFNEQQAEGVWRPEDTDTLIGKRVVVLGAGDLAVNLASRLAPFEAEVTLVGRRARPGVHALAEIDASSAATPTWWWPCCLGTSRPITSSMPNFLPSCATARWSSTPAGAGRSTPTPCSRN